MQEFVVVYFIDRCWIVRNKRKFHWTSPTLSPTTNSVFVCIQLSGDSFEMSINAIYEWKHFIYYTYYIMISLLILIFIPICYTQFVIMNIERMINDPKLEYLSRLQLFICAVNGNICNDKSEMDECALDLFLLIKAVNVATNKEAY